MNAFPFEGFDRNIPVSQIKIDFEHPVIELGPFSYLNSVPETHFLLAESKLKIGAFCSISKGLNLVYSEHRVNWTTTFPIDDILIQYTSRANLPIKATWSKGDIVIGNDVWIGHEVTILSGVTIGDGAVIGAGSVVSKDIPPYAIAAGSPIKILRYRFSEEIIARLLKLRWWDLTFNQIDEILPNLAAEPNKDFLDHLIAKYR